MRRQQEEARHGTGVALLHRPFRSNTYQETEAGLRQDSPNLRSLGGNSDIPAGYLSQALATFHDHVEHSYDDAVDRDRGERRASSRRWRVLNKDS